MQNSAITLRAVSFSYPEAPGPALRNVSLEIGAGEFVLVAGPSGSGKSTLLRTLNGLVPHFSGGRICGALRVDGLDPVAAGPRRMSAHVGLVQQDPESQFVVDTVEDELAFAMENQALPSALMHQRVERVLRQLGLVELRERRISTLSAGQKQRVAIAAVLTLQPRVLVLDEPTSQLDPQAADEVLTTLRRLNQDLGLTVLISEHRLERVVPYSDRIVYLPASGEPPLVGAPAEVLAQMPFAPPLVQLAKALRWRPLPVTVQDAWPFASALDLRVPTRPVQHGNGSAVVQAEDLWFDYEGIEALRGVSFHALEGDLIALMGHNGSGKTTLLKQLVGLLHPKQGRVLVNGMDTRQTSLHTLIQSVGYVPQDPNTLLFADTVRQELEFTRQAHHLPPAGIDNWLAALSLEGFATRYPRDLSVGERQRVALAAVVVAEPSILLLDEPTRGLDPPQKDTLAAFLRTQTRDGRTVIMATHDVELAAECADRVVMLSEGKIVLDGPARQAMRQSSVFATQMTKLFRDSRLLTVEDVLEAHGHEAPAVR